MSFWSWKSCCAIISFIGALSYQACYMPFGLPYLMSAVCLAFFAMGVVFTIYALQRTFSQKTIFLFMLSIMIGFGCATLMVLCSRTLFPSVELHPVFDRFIRFLLPIASIFGWFVGFNGVRFSTKPPIIDCLNAELSSQRKFFIPDIHVLADGRIIDLIRLGLFDQQIRVPSFILRELKILSETGDDVVKNRAKHALDSLRKIESIVPEGQLYVDIYAPDSLDLSEKIIFAAKAEQAIIITNENTARPEESLSNLFLDLETIASALKPPIPKGENLAIKIQRLGKEPKQGIGYLDDGTMVVVNGGGDFLGKLVKTQVLSQKYSSSGKIVFCNVKEELDDRNFIASVTAYSQIE